MGNRHFTGPAIIAALLLWPGVASAQTTVTIGIGTQDTTTNTVTTGTVIRELKLFEKHLPKDGKYASIKFQLEWNNFTSGPPVTNGMMANKLHIGMMGDYPLVVNGFTFQSNPESKSAADRGCRLQHLRLGQRARRAQGLALLRAVGSQGQGGQRAVRIGRPRHGAKGHAGPQMAGRLFPACQPKSRGRLDQPAGEEDRRPCRLRAVRRAASVPRFRPQDLRRRGDQRCRPGTASSCAPTSPRNIPKSWSPTSRP